MANEVGTATGLEDLFTKIVNFLTTNASLVAGGQQWQILRQHRDNIGGITVVSLTESPTANYRRILHSFRNDPRSLNTNGETGPTGHVSATTYVAGTSSITMTLRVAKAIATVRMGAPKDTNIATMLQNFRLQYSDDGSSWTTALTVNSNPTYSIGETKDFAVTGTPGSHLYWRIIIDRIQSGSASGTVTWRNLMLLESGGVVANHFGSEVNLKATGTAGTDIIYTGIRSEYDAANGWYNLFLNGYTGFDPLEVSWFKHPGAIPGWSTPTPMMVPMVPGWNSNMPYWFAASGRSFRFGIKVSTSFEGGYLGFILPYATPSQFPYPLAVGGSLVPNDGARSTEWRYSYNSWLHSIFTNPGARSDNPTDANDTTLYMRDSTGAWRWFGQRNSISDPNGMREMTQSLDPPFARSGLRAGVWPLSVRNAGANGARRDYREILGGGYIFQPLIMHQRLPVDAVWGELEGVYQVSGFSNASENTAMWGGNNHIILQNVSRTEVHEYWALALT